MTACGTALFNRQQPVTPVLTKNINLCRTIPLRKYKAQDDHKLWIEKQAAEKTDAVWPHYIDDLHALRHAVEECDAATK